MMMPQQTYSQNPTIPFFNGVTHPLSAKIAKSSVSPRLMNEKIKSFPELTKEIDGSKILENLLNKVQRVNFEQCSTSALLVKICDNLQDVTKRESLHLSSNELGNYVYNGQQWVKIETGELRQWLLKYALKMGVNNTTIKQYQNLDNLAKQFEVNFYTPQKARAKNLINLLNGTLDVETKNLRPHSPDDGFTYTLPFEYEYSATCPKFLQYLSEVLPDESVRKVIQEYMGYLFLDLKLEKVVLLYGNGANGKSVFLDVMTRLLGSANVTNYSLANLTREDGRYITGIASALLNISSDISNVILDSGVFKLMVSGEALSARALYKDPIIVTDYAKLIFSCNELPVTNDFSNGYFRRILIIPFSVEIPKDMQDKCLAKKIAADELPGILNWVLEGMARLVETNEFTDSSSVISQNDAYRTNCDNVAMFISEKGYKKNAEGKKLFKTLYEEYRSYCYSDGYKSLSKMKFSNRLKKLGCNIFNGAQRVTYVELEEISV
jgi:phage/plasmid primase, P4 family, C-terminal domain